MSIVKPNLYCPVYDIKGLYCPWLEVKNFRNILENFFKVLETVFVVWTSWKQSFLKVSATQSDLRIKPFKFRGKTRVEFAGTHSFPSPSPTLPRPVMLNVQKEFYAITCSPCAEWAVKRNTDNGRFCIVCFHAKFKWFYMEFRLPWVIVPLMVGWYH